MTDQQRRPLRQVGGKVEVRGDSLRSNALRRALEAPDDSNEDSVTHGFHSYPARMHPAIARSMLEDLVSLVDTPGRRPLVLDPFCGGGTVLIEARRLGAETVGVDLNPLAVRLAEVKAAGLTRKQQQVLGNRIQEIVARAPSRRGDRAPLSREETQWYAPHVLAELAALRAELTSAGAKWEQRALLMILSAIVVKVSRRRADTSDRLQDSTIRKGFTTEFFGNKATEFLQRSVALANDVPRKTLPPRVIEGDARHLPALLGPTRADVILTSPPYGGTYDYVDHHTLRYPWVGLDSRKFRDDEIGARRHMAEAKPARWDEEVGAALRSMAKVVHRGGHIVLLMGDGIVGGVRVPADEQVERLANKAGLELVAVASQAREDWLGGEARREHLLWLEHG